MLAAAVTALVSFLAPVPQEPITVQEDIQYSDVARQPRRNRLDLYLPSPKAAKPNVAGPKEAGPSVNGLTGSAVGADDAAPPPLVMFVHGGSWTGGHKDSYKWMGRTLASNGFACAVINTQLFPFAKPDVMVQDCGHALGFLHKNASKYGFDGNQLFVMGHSSGAHLSCWLALDDAQLKAAGVPKKALRGSVLLSGVYDIRSRHFALEAVFGADAEFRKRATPLLHADKNDAPVFLAWAQKDLPGLALCARMLRDRLLAADVPVAAHQYPNRNHADYIFTLAKHEDLIMKDVLQFLRDPQKATTKRVAKREQTLLWVATCEREHAVGDVIRKAMQPHGVDVLVQDFIDPTCNCVADAFRKLSANRKAANGMLPCYVGGIGQGGLAAATAPLTALKDGLLGRIVAGIALDSHSLAAFSQRSFAEDSSFLNESRLLSVLGDRDSKQKRSQAMHRTSSLLRKGREAHPIELANTTVEAALLALRADDNLVVPMLLAFLFP
ncbi:MAG: acetyl esterase/lipase [Planctomycetota bacterium]|jgi:acetyl esterase/lipase